jgi:exoribonuclease II
MEKYARTFVVAEEQEAFFRFMQPKEISKALKKTNLITRVFKIHREALECYMMVRIAAINHQDNRVGFGIHVVGVGFRDIDEETCRALLKTQARDQ